MRPHWRNPGQHIQFRERNGPTLPYSYSKTAASDAVLYLGGITLGHGNFAITSFPFSAVISKALLNPPSILSILEMGEETCGKSETSAQRASRSNLAYRFDISCFSLTKNRPLVYSYSCSRWIGSPRWSDGRQTELPVGVHLEHTATH